MATDNSSPGSGNQSTGTGGNNPSTGPVLPASGAQDVNIGSNATQAQKDTAQTNANLMSKLGPGGYDIQPDGTVVPKASSSVPIVTSNQSQVNMNNNMSTVNSATTALKNSIQAQIDKDNAQVDTLQKENGSSGNNTTTSPAPKTQTTNTDGSTVYTDSLGTTHQIPAGTDSSTVISQIELGNSDIKQAQSDQSMINTLRAYDVNTDPAAVAAVNSIKASYDILITQMQQKNAMVVGNLNTSAARGGAMQYASTMYDAANSQAVQAGIMRINDLQAKEADAIQKSNDAYASGNVKALDQATTDLKNAQAEARQTLQDVATTINNQVKDNLAQAKQDAADAKQQATLDTTTSKNSAQEVLNQITANGIKDLSQVPDSYYQDAAKTLGISDWTKLKSAVGLLSPTGGTAALKNANTQSTINARTAATNLAAQKASAAAAKTAGASDVKTKNTFDADLKKQITSLNTSIPSQKQSWGDAYNTMAQNYGNVTYMLDGVRVGLTQKLTPDQIKSAGGDPSVDQTILDIKLNKKANQSKGSS